ncbi:hypothetical protein [Mucilaginibacter psychrotolerans]|uniref:Nuclear transport factor 2 family protein n=1 Tax=Mucilaginibacter psychrotolerans TaxID=1524096 RepID=A0A4Y8S675_9SPHI|nr:hypothetical protein [Mucilaginibacter psychrotolerans]TFF34422.1 hypothetical protein E2R66_22370 [Mucilaginibacter psychrotolerans]
MKQSIKLLVLLLLPAAVYAQDPAVVKKQATVVADALVKGDYATVVNHTYPKALQLGGGKAKMLQMMTTGMQQMAAQGVSFESATVGTPSKFYKAGTEIHCLVPEHISMKVGGSTMKVNSNLLAVSSNKGKTWSFLDLNKNTIAMVPKLFPNFNKDLKLPEPKQ